MVEQFVKAVDFYIQWINKKCIKISLGSLTALDRNVGAGFRSDA